MWYVTINNELKELKDCTLEELNLVCGDKTAYIDCDMQCNNCPVEVTRCILELE